MVFLIDELVDLALSLGEYISQALEVLITAMMHPFIYIIVWIGNIVKLIFDTFVGLFNSMWFTFDILYSFISSMFTGFFPNLWTSIVLIGLSIVFFLRLYYFIKDISILGFKI